MDLQQFGLDQELIVAWGIKIALALVIFVVGRMLARSIAGVVARMMAKTVKNEALVDFVRTVLSSILLLVVIAAALDQLGVETTSLVAVVGAAGLAIGLAMKDSLQNVASGVMIIVLKPFGIGDYVEAAGVGGTVEKIGLFTTLMVTPDNREVILPNSSISGSTIVNFSARENRRIDLVFGIGYGDDIQKARAILQQLMAEETRILADPEPQIAVAELGASSVDFVVRPWVARSDYWPVRFELTERVKLAFDAAEISIPYPQQDLHLYQET